MPDDKLDMILNQIARVMDEINSFRQEVKQDMGAFRNDLSAAQERLAKSEQRLDDMHRERERTMDSMNLKVSEIYEDITGAKKSVEDMVQRKFNEQEKLCYSQRNSERQWVRNWILTGLVTLLVAVSSFFVIRFMDKTELNLYHVENVRK